MAGTLGLSRLATAALGARITCRAQSSRDPQLLFYSCSPSHHTLGPAGVASGDREGEGSQSSLFFARRAMMYVPASDQKKVLKTTTLSVDSLIFDIEDGVAVNKKDVAREAIGAAIATSRHDDSCSRLSEHVVRVNGVGSGLLNLDLREVFMSCESHGVSPDAIMLPKVESVEHVEELDLCLSHHHPSSLSPFPLHIITESPSGLLNLPDIAHFATNHTHFVKLCTIVFGSDDFLAAIGGVRGKGGSELDHARQTIVGVASANGVAAIDMVCTDFQNMVDLKAEAEAGVRMGFTGKQVIHPAQVGVVQEAFTPPTERLTWAKGLISAFEQHQTSGQGAFTYDGQMIDRPLLLQAQNIVRLHGNITRTSSNKI